MKTSFNLKVSCLVCLALAAGLQPGMALADSTPMWEENIQFFPQSGSPVWMTNFLAPDLGCNWSGVAGQVFDRQGVPLPGLVVNVSGVVNGNVVSYYVLSGSSLRMGGAGYEIKLADQALATQGELKLQLTDVAGTELSWPFSLVTSAACDQNLLIFNLVEMVITDRQFLPLIQR